MNDYIDITARPFLALRGIFVCYSDNKGLFKPCTKKCVCYSRKTDSRYRMGNSRRKNLFRAVYQLFQASSLDLSATGSGV